MTVSVQTPAVSYTANGVTTIFAYPFRILDATHLKVFLDGVPQVGGYSIDGVDAQGGGNVTFVVAPLNGVAVLFQRLTTRDQEADYQAYDAFPSETHERALDKLTMISQEVIAGSDHSIRVPSSEDISAINLILPDVAGRFNKAVSFDVDGNVIAASLLDLDLAAVSAYGETLITAADAVEAREVLGMNEARLWCGDAGGTANALTLTPDPAIPGYRTGALYAFKATATNGGAATVNVSGVGVKDIQNNGAALKAGDIVTGKWYELLYDGANMQLRKHVLAVNRAGDTLTGPLETLSTFEWHKGADIASAANIDLDAATGNLIDITGNTDIEGITLSVGRVRLCRFTGTLIVVNGTNLITGQDIFTVAGYTYVLFIGQTAGVRAILLTPSSEINAGAVPVNIALFSALNITLSATRWPVGYGQPTIGTSELKYWIPEDCTCDFMSVNLNAAPAANITMTLRKGGGNFLGADTAQTVTLNGNQQAVDDAHPIHFRKGDWFSIKCVSGALGVSTIDGVVCLRFVKYGTKQGLPCLWGNRLTGASGQLGGLDAAPGLTPITIAQSVIPLPNMAVMVAMNGTHYKNGITGIVSALPTETNNEAPADYEAGDTFQSDVSGLASWTAGGGGVRTAKPLGSTAYAQCPIIFGADAAAQAVTRFMGGIGRTNDAANNPTGSLTESEMEFIPPPGKAKGLYAHIDSTVGGAGQTITVTLRKNGADTGITVTFVTGGAIDLSETATEVAFNGTTDKAAFKVVASATSGARYTNCSLGYFRS